jgi:hypothetical protein
MLRRMTLVRTNVSEEHSASIIKVTRFSEVETLGVSVDSTAKVVPSSSILAKLMMELLCSSETSVLTKNHISSERAPVASYC